MHIILYICSTLGMCISVVTMPDFAMRYVSQYLGHDAIRIAILVYCVSQCLDLQFVYDGNAIYRQWIESGPWTAPGLWSCENGIVLRAN